MKYWLVKSEPSSFSWDDLWQSPQRTTSWEGVRNYQARNFLREMKQGDRVLFYHSSAEPNAIVGVAEVAREAYPDPTQFDRRHEMYDPKSSRDEPRWSTVDLRAVRAFPRPVTLSELRAVPALAKMTLLQQGSRLSVSAVTPDEWRAVSALAGISDAG
jgi:predicted RNA-binding protein with PUA-like domain